MSSFIYCFYLAILILISLFSWGNSASGNTAFCRQHCCFFLHMGWIIFLRNLQCFFLWPKLWILHGFCLLSARYSSTLIYGASVTYETYFLQVTLQIDFIGFITAAGFSMCITLTICVIPLNSVVLRGLNSFTVLAAWWLKVIMQLYITK